MLGILMKIVDCFLTKVFLDMTIYRVNQENFFNECTYFPPYEMIYYAQCIALAFEDQIITFLWTMLMKYTHGSIFLQFRLVD